MWPKITNNYSPNFNLPIRSKKTIQFIIVHYTGMKNETLAINKLCNSNSNVSAHYFIKQNGNILNLVPDLYQAWHAGKSSWKKFKSLNKYSIGIEIQNPGHEYGYRNFSFKQINSLKRLLKKLMKFYKINKNNILGHSDIAPERKKDPGEKFPWKKLGKFKLARWHTLNEKKLKKFRLIKLSQIKEEKFLKNLYRIGYNKIKSSKSNSKILAKAFQRRFRQNLINGKSDQECLLISKNLLKF
jgi:N-acetylmuramoyl-L-alanine amidase